MALPTTYGPLLKAVEEALTTDTGKPRALATADLFELGKAPVMDADVLRRDALVQKQVFVAIGAQQVPGTDFLEMGNRHRYDFLVRIHRYYSWDHELLPDETRDLVDLVASDFTKIRRTLCFPGNLQLTDGGVETGLAGQALRAEGASDAAPILDMGNRLMRVVASFPATIEMDSST